VAGSVKTIVFDARMYGLKHAGIGRYVKNLLLAFKGLEKEFSFKLLVREEDLGEIKKDLGDFYQYYPLKSPHYSLSEQREVSKVLKKLKPDLVHFPHFNVPVFYRGKYVVTIHDLIKHFYRGKETTTKSPFLYWPKYWGYRLVVKRAVKRAQKIIVPSFWWREKLGEIYRGSKSKIEVTWEAVDPSFLKKEEIGKKKKEGILEKYNLNDKQFFVYTGSVYPHKNIERLVKALRQLKRDGIYLAVVCSRSIFRDRLEKIVKALGMDGRVKFLGFVPDLELKVLYGKAIALAHPSLMEGFSLTGLEAMSVGCPVLSSNSSCLPEIYQKSVLYFDPLRVKEIKQAMEEILTDKILRKKLITRGKKQVAKYSWEKTANWLGEAYPDSDLYSAVYDSKKAPWAKKHFKDIYSSWLNYFPFAKGKYYWYLSLFPLAFKSFNFKKYDFSAPVFMAKGEFRKKVAKVFSLGF